MSSTSNTNNTNNSNTSNTSMRRPAILFAIAALIVVASQISSAAGLANHTSAIAGMPITAASWTLGPLHVLLYLMMVIVAPILAIAGTIDTLLLLHRMRAEHATPTEHDDVHATERSTI